LRRTSELGRLSVRTGWSTQTGAPQEVVTIMAYNALGTADIPPRPVIEPTIRREANTVRGFGSLAASLVNRGKDPRPALERQAEFLERAAKQALVTVGPANAESTIRSKGRNEPLVDSGTSRDHLVSRVVKR